MFNYNGIIVREKSDYLKNPRTKVTTTIRADYYEEYKNLMQAINVDMCKGYDIMLKLLSEDQELFKKYIELVKKY
ncbi:MAG: hypothetical protein ACRCVJ_11925 [Clostridium sp.]|uniref:hypothetical protein n=1 Tax=Clostridium sp. TaxID=1506 RepID=UPI003F3CA802